MADYIAAVRRYLALDAEVILALAPPAMDLNHDIWLFQERIQAVVEGSEACAAVLQTAGAWTGPNTHNTMRFPRLLLHIWADPDRMPDGHVMDPLTAKDKIDAAYEAIDPHLHRPYGGAFTLSDVRFLGSHRLSEPEYFDVPDADGVKRAQVAYGLSLG